MKLFKSRIIKFLCVSFILFIGSCSHNKYADENERLRAQCDSLSNLASQSGEEYQDIMQYITTLEVSMDSIAECESMLTITSEEKNLTREKLRERVNTFGNVLRRQKEKISVLEDSLKSARGASSHLLSIVTSLRAQLDAKDRELAELTANLNNSKKTISELQTSFKRVAEANTELSQKNEVLETVVETQNNAINTGYILIATKKELREQGILEKAKFLKKSNVIYSSFNSADFKTVDIRTFSGTTIYGKKPKLLTAAPSSSYTIEKINKNEWEFRILSPADFWSISNYLVIQTD